VKRGVSLSLVLATLLVPDGAPAQTPPDFTGKWMLVPPASAPGVAMGSAPATLSAPGTMGSGWGSDITVTQDATALTVEFTYFHPRDVQPPFKLKYLLNGAESRNTLNMGRGPQEQVATASWVGDTLVITTAHSFLNPQNGQTMTSETRQAVSLESPTSLVIETTRNAVMGGKPSSTRSIYRKQ